MTYLSYTTEFQDNLLMLMLRDHKRYMPIVEFFDNVTHGLTELSWAEAELIAAQVSKANHSEFCNGMRSGMSKALQADPAILNSEKFAPLLAFAFKVNQDASTVGLHDVQTVLNVGWSEQTIEDITGLVAIQKLYNIIATGLGFKGLPEEMFTEIGRNTVSEGSYSASFRSIIDSMRTA